MYTKSKFNFIVILTIVLLFALTAITMYSVDQVQRVKGIETSFDCLATQDIKNNKAVETSNKKNNYDFKLFGIIPIGKSHGSGEKSTLNLADIPLE